MTIPRRPIYTDTQAPAFAGSIHRSSWSILIHQSLFCLIESKSGRASLKTSQAGHIASTYGNKPIKTTCLSLGVRQIGYWIRVPGSFPYQHSYSFPQVWVLASFLTTDHWEVFSRMLPANNLHHYLETLY